MSSPFIPAQEAIVQASVEIEGDAGTVTASSIQGSGSPALAACLTNATRRSLPSPSPSPPPRPASPELAYPSSISHRRTHLPYLSAELRFGVDHEGALSAEDLVDRRTRIGLVPADRAPALAAAASLVPG